MICDNIMGIKRRNIIEMTILNKGMALGTFLVIEGAFENVLAP